jgi:hypothetical protein
MAIRAAAAYNREAFLSDELPKREALGYPPYVRLANVLVWGKDEAEVSSYARRLYQGLVDHLFGAVSGSDKPLGEGVHATGSQWGRGDANGECSQSGRGSKDDAQSGLGRGDANGECGRPGTGTVRATGSQTGDQKGALVVPKGRMDAWTCLPAVPCVLSKLRDAYRYHIVVKAPAGEDIAQALSPFFRSRKPQKSLNVAVDIDPYNLL